MGKGQSLHAWGRGHVAGTGGMSEDGDSDGDGDERSTISLPSAPGKPRASTRPRSCMPRQVIEHTIRFRGTSTGACLKITSRSTPRRLPVAPSLRRWMWTRDGQELETGRRSFQPSQIGGGGDGSGRNGEGGGGAAVGAGARVTVRTWGSVAWRGPQSRRRIRSRERREWYLATHRWSRVRGARHGPMPRGRPGVEVGKCVRHPLR